MSVHSCALHSDTIIHLRGSDIAKFLQGQLSCDTRELSTARPISGAFCNAKGRVLADLRVLMLSEEHCVLRLRKSISSGCAAALEVYARFSRITCEVDSGAFALMGVRGSDAIDQLSELGLKPPATLQEMTHNNGVVCYYNAVNMLEILGPSERIKELIGATTEADSTDGSQSGENQAAEEREEQWRAQTLLHGIFRLELEDVGEFTPQALNFDLAGYVSFSKGCYTGQEIIARLHYKGQTKRRLAVFTTTSPAATTATPGFSRGIAVSTAAGEAVGEILRFYQRNPEEYVLAVILRADFAADSLLQVFGAQEYSLVPVSTALPAAG